MHGLEAVEHRQQLRHLVVRHHHRQAALLPGPPDLAQPRQIHAQHLLIEEQQRRQSLLVRGRRDLALGREKAEKSFDLKLRHLARMAQPMKLDEGAHPMHVSLFGAQAVVQRAHLLTQRVEQAQRRNVGAWMRGGLRGCVRGERHRLALLRE